MDKLEQDVRDKGAAYLAAKQAAEQVGYRVEVQKNADGESVLVSGGPAPMVLVEEVRVGPSTVAQTVSQPTTAAVKAEASTFGSPKTP